MKSSDKDSELNFTWDPDAPCSVKHDGSGVGTVENPRDLAGYFRFLEEALPGVPITKRPEPVVDKVFEL